MAVAVSQVSVAPYFSKAFGKYVLDKPSDKLFTAQRHLLLLTIISIIVITKGYGVFFLIDTLYPMVADGYFVGVTAKILKL